MEEEIVKVSYFHPLFSCFITLCSLNLIYFPNGLIRILFSPVLLISGSLLMIRILLSPVLLISGALLISLLRLGSTRESNTRPEKRLVIHEEAEDSKVLLDWESDSVSSSEFSFPVIRDWNSLDNMGFFRWEEEKEDDGIGGEGLIEIKLNDEYNQRKMSKWNQTELDFHGEEDGFIEIDLFQ